MNIRLEGTKPEIEAFVTKLKETFDNVVSPKNAYPNSDGTYRFYLNNLTLKGGEKVIRRFKFDKEIS